VISVPGPQRWLHCLAWLSGAHAALSLLGACSPGKGPTLAPARPATTAALTVSLPASSAVPTRDAGAPPLLVARRVVGAPPPARATRLIMGEGWGCAAFESEAGSPWQCWEASRAPIAWSVPWLKNMRLRAGPDRVCEYTPPSLEFRCWYRPRRGDAAGRELPASWEWLNPNHTGWEDAYSRSDRIGQVFVGGTFGCVQETRYQAVWCLGNDAFGQLGGSKPVPPADATREDASFLRGIWPARQVALGTWHGCVIAVAGDSPNSGRLACWGRGDQGQLGSLRAAAATGASRAGARAATDSSARPDRVPPRCDAPGRLSMAPSRHRTPHAHRLPSPFKVCRASSTGWRLAREASA
jgi:hypothetical protein